MLDHSRTDAEIILEQLRQFGYQPEWQCGLNSEDDLDHLDESFQVIIQGNSQSESAPLELLKLLGEKQLDIPLIVITDRLNQKLAVECMKAGATDYLHQEELNQLGQVVASAIQTKKNLAEKRQAEKRKIEQQLKQTEAALRKSEEKFRNLVELSLVGIYVIQDGLIAYANPTLAEISGYSLTEMIGQPVLNFIAPEDRDLVAENIRKRLEGEVKSLRYLLHFQHKNGSLIDVEVHGTRIDLDGKPAIIGILLDITITKQGEFALKKINEYLESKVEERTTFLRQLVRRLLTEINERHRVESALRLSEERYTMAVNGGQVGVWDCDLTTNEIYLAPILKKMLGYENNEEIAHDPQELIKLIHPDDQQRGLETISAHLQGLIPQIEIEHRLIHKYGSIRWFLSRGKAFRDHRGKPERLAGSSTDITKRKQIEEALKESEIRFRELAENIREVFWMTSVDKTVMLYVSPAYEEIWGYTCADLYSQPLAWLEAIHPEDRDRIFAAIFEKQAPGEYKEEYRIIRPDNSVRWIRDLAFPIRNETGEVYRIAGIAEDITDDKQAQAEISKALDKEKELNELKSRFVTMTSHEFRTPLSTILSAAELLEYYGHEWTKEENLEQLHFIQDAVKHITQLLEEVLFIGHNQVRKLQFQPVSLELNEFCRELVHRIGNYSLARINQPADQDHRSLTYSRPVINFVSPEQPLWVYADEKLLRQILNNLLSNAIKYSPYGGTVQLELSYMNEEIILVVEDQGLGILPEDQPFLFDSFHRGKNVGNIPGTGLGLAIVKECVDLHHGQISVSSQVGAGTKFVVALPLQKSC